MKKLYFWILVFSVIAIDQITKFYIKLHFFMGEKRAVVGHWFYLYFTENPGMAYGWKLGEGSWAKIMLTSFRLVAVIVGFFFIKRFFKKMFPFGFYFFVALIYAGAIGNLIDSLFYGQLFSASFDFIQQPAEFLPVAGGYAPLFLGKVVDMLYFPIIENALFPQWVPFFGGDSFTFFSPIFNVADSAISTGVIGLLIFQKKLFVSNV
ncbi:MAG: lipoprotein signal peptidase [Sediminibacterium sp.]|nr:lipoprotein signal peptidase [Sediminibacterium sp.]